MLAQIIHRNTPFARPSLHIFQQIPRISKMGNIANDCIAGIHHILIGFYNGITPGDTLQWRIKGVVEAFRNSNGSLHRMIGNQQIQFQIDIPFLNCFYR